MSFYTESRTEALLERETRVVPGPGGAPMSVDALKAFWKAYDFLVFFGIYTPEEIAERALSSSERLGIPYGKSFSSAVWRANGHARKVLGVDCFGVRPTPD